MRATAQWTSPRFYVDADIVVTAAALHEVAGRMSEPVEAGAPSSFVDTSRSSFLVRRYYDVCGRACPISTRGLVGSGVVGVSEGGRSRFGEFPDVIADDDFVRRLFSVHDRVASTDEMFTITARAQYALIRVKTRSRLGVLQLDEIYGPAEIDTSSGSSRRALFELARRQPRFWVSTRSTAQSGP